MFIASVLKGGGNFRKLLNKLLELKTENPKRLKEFFQLLEWYTEYPKHYRGFLVNYPL